MSVSLVASCACVGSNDVTRNQPGTQNTIEIYDNDVSRLSLPVATPLLQQTAATTVSEKPFVKTPTSLAGTCHSDPTKSVDVFMGKKIQYPRTIPNRLLTMPT